MTTVATGTADQNNDTMPRASAVAQRVFSLLDQIGRRLSLVTETSSSPQLSHEFNRLEAEVLRLSRERAQITAENQLLNEIIGRGGQEGAARLLRRLAPHTSSGFAALIDLSSSPCVVASRGTLLDNRTGFPLSDGLLQRLRNEPHLIQAVGTSHPDECSVVPGWQGELFFVPISDEQSLSGALMTTTLWPGGLHRAEQAEILGRAGQTVLRRLKQDRQVQLREDELWLSREMLSLKSITDRVTDQPLETLGALASQLCRVTGMDRAALYLASRRADDVVVPVVEAGPSELQIISNEWRRHEASLATRASNVDTGLFLDRSLLDAVGIHTLWGQAVVWQLSSGGKSMGTFVLSRSSPEPLSERNRKLIRWSCELVSQTLLRIFRDAAIRRQARHDGLTDLANRRTFDALLTCEIDRVRMGLSEECSLLLADLDRFKSINDQHGHQAGDEVLRVTAQLLREHVGRMRIGERSLLARYGGEELAVLLPGVGTAGAVRVAEEIRTAVERRCIAFGEKRLGVTVSIGVANCPVHGMGPTELVAAADSALYRAKSEGRNRVCSTGD